MKDTSIIGMCNENGLNTLEDYDLFWETAFGDMPGYQVDKEKFLAIAEHMIKVLIENDGVVPRCTYAMKKLMEFPATKGECNLALYALEYARIISYGTWFGEEVYSERGYILVREPSKYWKREFYSALKLVISLLLMILQLKEDSPSMIENLKSGAPLKLKWLFTQEEIDIEEILTRETACD